MSLTIPTRHSRGQSQSRGQSLLRSVAALTTPLLPDDYLTLVNPLWSTRELRGRIDHVRHETADAATLTIRAGRGWSAPTAGQWVRIGIEIDGIWQSRTYSVTSVCDGRTDSFTITVKAITDGRVSNHLVRRTRVGTVVRIDVPRGEFCLPQRFERPVLFLTGGSGITPVMGMLRTLSADGDLPDAVHVHSALHRDDVIFGSDLRDLAARFPSYQLHEQHTDVDGFFSLDSLEEICPDWREREVWACGPVGLIDAIEKHWADAGVSELLHIERFLLPVFAAPDADGGTVTFATTGRDAEAIAGRPILEVGEEAGVTMPNGCRMGICFTCVAPLRSGQVRNLRTGEIHGDEGELIQTCISAAAGDCSIDL
jgi:stearoyl-CoA 9-desaturase NADPH oxidoreductase